MSINGRSLRGELKMKEAYCLHRLGKISFIACEHGGSYFSVRSLRLDRRWIEPPPTIVSLVKRPFGGGLYERSSGCHLAYSEWLVGSQPVAWELSRGSHWYSQAWLHGCC